MPWRWRTERGVVLVDRGQGDGFEPIALPGPDALTARIEGEWLDLAGKHAARAGIPVSWVLAVIYSESGGNPTAHNDCCAGLMALALQVYGISQAEAFDPDTNVRLGADTLARYAQKGFDLPRVASCYNAGPCTTHDPNNPKMLCADGEPIGGPKSLRSSPWGYRENFPAVPWSGYIEKVVRASNWWQLRLGDRPGPTPDPQPPPTLAGASPMKGGPVLAGLAALAGAYWLTHRALRKSR